MRLLAVLCSALLASPALAADGDQLRPTTRARLNIAPLLLLCDSKAAADAGSDCSDLRVRNPPDTYIFSVNTAAGCSAYSVILKHQAVAGGVEHTVATLSNGGSTYHKEEGPLSEILLVTLTTLTDCTDFDLTVELLYDEP